MYYLHAELDSWRDGESRDGRYSCLGVRNFLYLSHASTNLEILWLAQMRRKAKGIRDRVGGSKAFL